MVALERAVGVGGTRSMNDRTMLKGKDCTEARRSKVSCGEARRLRVIVWEGTEVGDGTRPKGKRKPEEGSGVGRIGG